MLKLIGETSAHFLDALELFVKPSLLLILQIIGLFLMPRGLTGVGFVLSALLLMITFQDALLTVQFPSFALPSLKIGDWTDIIGAIVGSGALIISIVTLRNAIETAKQDRKSAQEQTKRLLQAQQEELRRETQFKLLGEYSTAFLRPLLKRLCCFLTAF
jgi:hypothetical protein